MKKIATILLLCMTVMRIQASVPNTHTVANDPMKTHFYVLPNGLTIYLSNNPEQPRIQTYIAVRAGGKNDPAESTGLAHYLEHLMFKGTSKFGTQNYAAERPILDQIEAQYEVYGKTTDPGQRKAIYHVIDSLSYAASQFAIANEYDKLMAGIGSEGTNAYTSEDVTCYIEDIPSNEIERWAKVQSNRFQDLVIRGFHTELEAVYEEFNIHLTSDNDKIMQAVNSALFPHHPYGTQTVIGTQEHLKNPSLENVKRFHKQWYVPNNVAICMSGDLGENLDSIVTILEHTFGDWKPNYELPKLNFEYEKPLTSPVYKEVLGRERDMAVLAWRMPRVGNFQSYDKLEVLAQLLHNGKAGLFDLDLNQSQQVLASYCYASGMADYSSLMTIALPKEGQTLEQVRDLILQEMEKIKKGDFPDSMLKAIVNNMKRSYMQSLESNESRASQMVEAFVNGMEWSDVVKRIDRISRLTKQDIVDFAKTHLTDGYVCVYKKQGEDPNEKKIDKPAISPIEMNRDKQSRFVSELLAQTVKPIAPKFIDFDKDMSKTTLKNGNQLLYKHNDDNQLFQLSYIIEHGTKQDAKLDLATGYIDYLGAGKLSAEQLQSELYRLACDVKVRAGVERTIISIRGLQENMKAAMQLAEDWIYKSTPNEDVLQSLVNDILKARSDDKLEQKTNFQRLTSYGIYGPVNASTHILSEAEMKAIKPAELLQALRSLKDYEQTICYYGPASEAEVAKLLKQHAMSAQPIAAEPNNYYKTQVVTQPEILIAPYDAKNIYMRSYSNNGQVYDPAQQAATDLFNEYFGGGMNTVVFQELREARGLAYSASAYYVDPSHKGDTNYFFENIITQNDKMKDCLDVFKQITEELPLDEGAFKLAKDAILKRMATQRTTRGSVLNYYMALKDLGLTADPNERIYNQIKAMSLADLANFHKQNIKGRTYRYLILGDEKELDMETLKKLGTIKRVTTEEIFGY